MSGDVLVSDVGDVSDGADEVIEVLAAGHNTDKIGTGGEVDNAAVVELFLAGVKVSPFAEFMGDDNVLGNTGDKALGKFGLA